jgi:hypothetical protein
MRDLVQDTYRARNGTAKLYFLNFNIENENFKILNPAADGSKVPR